MLLPFVASCDNDNGGNKPGGATEVTLPSMDFGQTMSRIQEIEADRGFTVTQTDGKHLTAVKNENGSEVKYVYALPQFGITECLIQHKCSVHTPPSHAIRSG